MDEFDPDATDDSRDLVCSNFIACHTIWYDNTNLDSGYSLGRVIVHVRPPAQHHFPLVIARQCLFVQFYGTPDEYVVRVRQVRVELSDDGEERDVEIGDFGPWDIAIPGENYVECFGFALTRVRYPQAGVYEFQLWVDGVDHPLGRERLEARE